MTLALANATLADTAVYGDGLEVLEGTVVKHPMAVGPIQAPVERSIPFAPLGRLAMARAEKSRATLLAMAPS